MELDAAWEKKAREFVKNGFFLSLLFSFPPFLYVLP